MTIKTIKTSEGGQGVDTDKLGVIVNSGDYREMQIKLPPKPEFDRLRKIEDLLFFAGETPDSSGKVNLLLRTQDGVTLEVSKGSKNYPFKITVTDKREGSAIYLVYLGLDNQYYQSTMVGEIPLESRQRISGVIGTDHGPRPSELTLDPLPGDISFLVDNLLKRFD